MSRTRYYRTKRVYPKQKWLPVNNELTIPYATAIPSGNFYISYVVVTQNATRTNNNGEGNISSASILKVGRFRFKGVIQSTSNSSYIIGIAYIPEGYAINAGVNASVDNLGETFFYRHPEWVLCWTRMDYTSTSAQNNEIRLSSKLKRNLNSGDGIVLFAIAVNKTTGANNGFPIHGTVSYVCRTN